MDRRKILSWVGLGWLVSVLPPTLTSCVADKQSNNSLTALAETVSPKSLAKSSVTTTATTTASKGTRIIGSLAQLERDGQLIADGVIVVRDRANPQKLFAVNPICTHKGCDVNWQKDNQEFFCPCHDATFASDGSPRQAPAKIPLATYPVKVENNQVVIAGIGENTPPTNSPTTGASTEASSLRSDLSSARSETEQEESEERRSRKERKDRDCQDDQ